MAGCVDGSRSMAFPQATRIPFSFVPASFSKRVENYGKITLKHWNGCSFAEPQSRLMSFFETEICAPQGNSKHEFTFSEFANSLPPPRKFTTRFQFIVPWAIGS
jgi:hypothetical protein